MSQSDRQLSDERLAKLKFADDILANLENHTMSLVRACGSFADILWNRRSLEVDVYEANVDDSIARAVEFNEDVVDTAEVTSLIAEFSAFTTRLNDFGDAIAGPNQSSSLHKAVELRRANLPSDTPYRYIPLNPGEIRILELLPGSETAEIAMVIRHVLVNKFHDFEALSYTWGVDQPDRVVRLDGKTYSVTSNLEAALKELRTDEKRSLWVDAICINQADLKERSLQVLLMRSIYTLSKRVIIWLGTGTVDSDRAMDFLITLQSKEKEGRTVARNWVNEFTASQPYEETFQSLANLYTRPWFSRVWIMQEYALSARTENGAIFVCGSKQVLSIIIYGGFFVEPQTQSPTYHRQRIIFDQLLKGYSRVASLYSMRTSVSVNSLTRELSKSNSTYAINQRDAFLLSERQVGLHKWIVKCRDSLATDPRDKVYGVLGLAEVLKDGEADKGHDPRCLAIDYSFSVEDVYASAVRSIIVATGKLDILTSCSNRSTLITRTWVPDWTIPGRSSYMDIDQKPGTSPHFCAAGASSCVVLFHEKLTTLKVRGILWDTIRKIFSCPAQRQVLKEEAPIQEYVKRGYQKMWRSLKESEVYGGEQFTKLAFWRTLICGNRRSSTPAMNNLKRTSAFEPPINQATTAPSGLVDWPEDDKTPSEKGVFNSRPSWSSPDLLASLNSFNPSNRNILMTERGYIGQTLYTGVVEKRDIVCVLLGCQVPMILRRRGMVGTQYELIGDLYLEGIMHGEVMKALDEKEIELEDFELV